ncbi:MAG: hypothetical protein WEA76_02705 [Acidimicrobiia bacterium]
MDRFRRSLDEMTSAQRASLGLLGSVVLIVAIVAIVVTVTRVADEDLAVSTSTTSQTPSSVTSLTTTTAATTTTTADATTTAPTTTVTTIETTTTTNPVSELVLRPDGVGDFLFGEAANEVLGALLAVLGDPDEDTGWVDQAERFGVCLGSEVRFVRWGSFQVFFTDGPSDWAPAGTRHFASYTQATYFEADEVDLVTADGLSLGSPVGDVRAIYGSDSVYDDLLYGPVFFYDPPGPAQQWGLVTGLDPDDTIESINGSFACGE